MEIPELTSQLKLFTSFLYGKKDKIWKTYGKQWWIGTNGMKLRNLRSQHDMTMLYIYIYIYIGVKIWICMHIYPCIYICINTYTCVYNVLCICTFIWVCVYMCLCARVGDIWEVGERTAADLPSQKPYKLDEEGTLDT